MWRDESVENDLASIFDDIIVNSRGVGKKYITLLQWSALSLSDCFKLLAAGLSIAELLVNTSYY